MVKFEDVQTQLIDLPPVSTEYTEPWFPEILRNADLWLLVLDLGQDPLAQMEEVRGILQGFKLGWGGKSASDHLPSGWKVQPILIAANKLDLPDGPDTFQLFQEMLSEPFPLLATEIRGDSLFQTGPTPGSRRPPFSPNFFNAANISPAYSCPWAR